MKWGGNQRTVAAAAKAIATLGPVLRLASLAIVVQLAVLTLPAHALKPIVVSPDQDRLEITTLGEAYEGRGDSLMVETAAGADGIGGRMSVKATTQGTNPNWMVFALTNPTDKPIERWLTADRYTISGSGIIWPDLDARRIEAVTPSIGFVPQRIKSDRADIFAVTLEPGQTITYIAELSSERFTRVYLWKPLEFEVKVRDRQLFNGIMLGLSVLTALFLTVIFAANHRLIFPAAALFSWAVLAYLCVDFGFFHKLFNMKPEDNAVYRAAAESAMAASLVIFMHVFLRLGLSHGLLRMLSLVWILAQLALVAVAAIDPRLAATFARASFAVIGGVGALATLYLALRGQDRAMHLVPPWIMFLVWIFLGAVTLTGRLSGEVFVSALIGGLVLIVLLIGFTVTQFAFRSPEPLAGLAPSDSQLRALAVDGAQSAVWEWSSRRDEIKTGAIVEQTLGLNPGELNVKVDEFMLHIHPADRESFRLSLWSVQERSGGKIRSSFRMRHIDNTYRWFELEAASVETSDRRTVRCVGLMRDVTDAKMAHERLLQDAVHCNLTGLPNRELLLDRLQNTIQRAKSDPNIRPAVFVIDIDKFKSFNSKLGFVVGDSLLLTAARRLQRHLGPQDTLARMGGDQFAILFVDQQDPRELAGLAERVRRSLRAPIRISSQELVLTGSLGIAIFDGNEDEHCDLLKEAEIAMYKAKRSGSDRVEIFKPEMRGETNDRDAMEAMLRKAIEKNQLKVVYQPIVYLPTQELAGFEALVRMEHPKFGLISPAAFIPIAEESDLIIKLGSFVLARAVADVQTWQKELPRPEDALFVSVNVSSRQVLRSDLVQEVRNIIGRTSLAKGTLKLEITESLAMENPEHAVEILSQIKSAGAELAIDDFGTGYSSLSYLQRLPCDTIKLDRSLVRSAGTGEESSATIVRAMVALAHELGKKVVAEGIEAADDVVFLRSIGCEFGQGYYYGEPMGDRDVIDLLRIIRKSERKLQTHGFFKTKLRQDRKRRKRQEAAETAAAAANGAAANGGASETPVVASSRTASGKGASVPAAPSRPLTEALPQSMVRPRHRQNVHAMPETQPHQASRAPFADLIALNAAMSGSSSQVLAPAQAGQARAAGQPGPVQTSRTVVNSLPPSLSAAGAHVVAGPPASPPLQAAAATTAAYPGTRTAPPAAAAAGGPPPPPANGSSAAVASAPPPLPAAPGQQVRANVGVPAPNGSRRPQSPPSIGSVSTPAIITPAHAGGGDPAHAVAPPAPAPAPLQPDFSTLPPGIAASLARLAGIIEAPPGSDPSSKK